VICGIFGLSNFIHIDPFNICCAERFLLLVMGSPCFDINFFRWCLKTTSEYFWRPIDNTKTKAQHHQPEKMDVITGLLLRSCNFERKKIDVSIPTETM